MGASNFSRGNTSRVYAVLMDIEESYSRCTECSEKHFQWEENYVEEGYKDCPDCGSTDCIEHSEEYRCSEQYEYDDFKKYLQEVAEEKTKETVFRYSDENYSDNDRNYCATDLFSLQTSKSYGDIEVELKIIGQIVSGYYEGASLDFRLEIYNGWEWSEVDRNYDAESILEGLFDVGYDSCRSDMNKGLRNILHTKATSWAEKESQKMIDLVEKIFTEVSMPLNVVGTFSNGETVYEKV
jgi:hypothetical protein